MLTASVCELTRPMNSSIVLGGWPAASIRVGLLINFAIAAVFPGNKEMLHLACRSQLYWKSSEP